MHTTDSQAAQKELCGRPYREKRAHTAWRRQGRGAQLSFVFAVTGAQLIYSVC